MLLFLLFVLGTCDQIVGGGSPSSAQLFEEWSFAYEVLVTDATQVGFDYTSYDTSTDAMKDLQTRCRKIFNLDYSGLDKPLIQYTTSTQDELDAIPIFGETVAFVYNFSQGNYTTAPLMLTETEIADIFTGKIKTWGKIAWVNTNMPQIANETIQLVFRDDDNGLTRVLTQYLTSISQDWVAMWPPGGSVFSSWALDSKATNFTNYTKIVNWTPVTGPYGTIAQVLYNNFTLGYSSLNFAVQGQLQLASIVDRNGTVWKPNPSSTDDSFADAVEVALNNFNLTGNDVNGTSVINVPDAYPLVQLSYIAYHNDSTVDCELRRSLFLFLYWALNDTTARDRATSLKYVPLPDTERPKDGKPWPEFPTTAFGKAFQKLNSVQCGGESLLAIRLYDDTRTLTRQIVSSLSAVMLSLTVAVLLTLGYKRNNRITKAAGLAFAICFLVGCILNYASLFIWALTPSSDAICSTRVALLFVGYSLILGAMFAKSWEISKIFYRAEKGDISPFQELPWWKFCRVFFFIVGIETLIILVWMVSDSPQSTLDLYEPRLLLARYTCQMKAGKVWLSLQVIYYVVLMIWGSYLAYITRDIWAKYNYPNESRSILLSIFNMGFVAIALLPMVYVLDITDDVFFFLVSVTILIPTSFALLSVYVPKVLEFLGSANSSKHSKGSAQKKTASGLPNSKTAKSWVEMEPIKGGRGHDGEEVDLVQAVSGSSPAGSGGGILRKSDSNLKGSNRTESRLGVEMVPMSLNRVAEEDEGEDAVSVVELEKDRPRGHSNQKTSKSSKKQRAHLGGSQGAAAPTTPRRKIEDETLQMSGWRILASVKAPVEVPIGDEKTPFFTSIFDSPEAAAQSDLMTGGVEDVASMIRPVAKEHRHAD